MMTRTEVMKELKMRGYEVESKDVVKNGVTLHGITFLNEEVVAPVIYMDGFLELAEQKGMNVVDEVISIYEHSKGKLDKNILEKLTDRNWLLEHLQIYVQKNSDQDLIKKEVKEMEGIEAFLAIRAEENEESISITLQKNQLNWFGMSEMELWEVAYRNLCEETKIVGMSQMMNELIGMPVVDDENEEMFVISNECKMKGASAILNRAALQTFAKRRGVNKLFVLPSSIHEMLIVPDNGRFTIEDLSEMVREVNENEVSPEERLTDHAYVLAF